MNNLYKVKPEKKIIKFFSFVLYDKNYCVKLESIKTIIDIQKIFPLNNKDILVYGLINYRETVIPIFDPALILNKTINNKENNFLDNEGIIIFEVNNGTQLPFIALRCDQVGRIIKIPEDTISKHLSTNSEEFFPYIEKNLLFEENIYYILNIDAMVTKEVLFERAKQ